jgi:CheY-like chemotaxis protein
MLALTANAQSEDRDACLAAGMDGLLVKPLDRERLREALDAVAARLAA